MNNDRVSILGCEIDRLDMAATLAHCQAVIEHRRYTQHVAINAAKLVTLRRQPELREIVGQCSSSAPMGSPSCGPRACSATRCPSVWRAST
jgi:UDP-N-acetyl-D-mannosaminuronic acid transferase (WecB/TagA/CpsF family)